MTSKKLQPSRERPSRLNRALSVWGKISPSKRTSLSKIDDRNERHLPVDEPNNKGALGLNLLHDPPNPKIDFIFVHGLGGGSRKTWASSADPEQYWLKAWLPQDPEFSSVRIHSFGYNADWNNWRTNTLSVLDFARSLLGEMSCNTKIRRSSTKIVLIGHSMGGIVIKKAYMLAREDNSLNRFATRIHTIYFLATPHRGSDYSKAFANILAISYGQKSFVSELSRDSTSIASINDSFRHYSSELDLWSFYETDPTIIFGIQSIIVDVASATLGLQNETCRPLNADHRGVCKFQSEDDSNYRTLRSCFITSIDKISADNIAIMLRDNALELEQLALVSGTCDVPDEELIARENIRIPGTCEWLIKHPSFTSWQGALNGDRPIFWLAGIAGAGKSILCSRIVIHLQHSDTRCSYFFFRSGDPQKSSLAMCLRSLVYQMARADSSILRGLLEMELNSSCWESWDDKKLWRQLFLAQIFKGANQNVHHWVIDSVDECQKSQQFLNLLIDTPPWLKIFFTSRSSIYSVEDVSVLTGRLEFYQMQSADTLADFKVLIDMNLAHMPASRKKDREDLRDKILDKASGSFLWVSLVTSILAKSYSEEAAEEILEEVPTNMNSLYSEMLQNVLQDRRAVVLAKSLYTWTLLSLRPLKVESLHAVLKLDTNQTVHNLDKIIPVISGQLLTVNQHHEAEVIHQTAKSYLLQQEQHPNLVLDKLQCHTKMAQICLGILARVYTDTQPSRKLSRHSKSFLYITTPDLVDYASEHFSDHLQRSSTEDDNNWELLCKFFDGNILAWIEFLAQKRHIRSITRTAQNLHSFFRRRVSVSPQKAKLESWIYDLFRLTAKFGTNITLAPSSIHHLIPSMCPSESNLSKYETDTLSHTSFSIKGIKDNSWGDCLARIDYPDYHICAVICGDQYSAVALTNGSIHLYFQESGQLKFTLNHSARANVLLFSNEDRYLASSGQQKVRIWDCAEGVQLWVFETKHRILHLSFTDNDYALAGASQGNRVIRWDLQSGKEYDQWQWTDSVQRLGETKRSWPQPSKAVFSPDHGFLAVNYRGLPLHLFNLSSQKFVGTFIRECETGINSIVNIEAFAFNPISENRALIVSYADGELIMYDTVSKQVLYRMLDVFAHSLRCSHNGRTLITGSSRGIIRIFELAGPRGERLLPLYSINAQENGIRDIAISSSSLRFADIRGTQYRLWEPAVLLYNDMDEGSRNELNHPISIEVGSIGVLGAEPEPEITALHCHSNGNFVFCGKRNGSVSYFETSTAKHRQILYRHASDISITCIMYIQDKQLLVTADESGRVLINKVTASDTGFDFCCYVNEIRSEQSLSLLLHDTSGTRILLRGNNSTEIWTTEGHNLGVNLNVDGNTLLINHPLQPGYLVAVSNHSIGIFSWKDGLSTTQSFIGKQEVDLMITPPTSTQVQQRFAEGIVQCEEPWSSPFIVKLCRHNLRGALKHNEATDMIYIWPASSVTKNSDMLPSIPLGDFISHAHRIWQIIAMADNLLFFLDTDLWICSLDITNKSTIFSGAKRHCFLLSEWRSVDGSFLIEYIPLTREFVVSRKHELLVISGGLEFEEPWI